MRMMAGGEVDEESGVCVGRDVLGDFDKQQVSSRKCSRRARRARRFVFLGQTAPKI
jgi:hypothetical protein